MSVINILSPHVADMIAAGEVVERPASVIKELIENSVDAGAKNVTVEIRRGGMSYIRVTDDGCGMSPEDAGIAFLRHATSKLKDESGLAAIGTMGFRGEALAAISSVSRVELRTRRKGSIEGTFVSLEGGDITDMTPTGCPEGTTMVIRDLFYNTPARLKFMKSDRSESSACQAAALRCALGHPDISIRFIRDDNEEFFSPGDGKAESACYSLLGREIASGFLPCEGGSDGISVSGFVSSPAAARGNRSAQYFFCNGRYIKSTLLQSALEQAYKNRLLVGRFPACVLYISLALSEVDVNVHPAKTEIKFSAEKQVFDALYYSVLNALDGESKPVEIEISTSTAKAVSNPSFYRSMPASEYRSAVAGKSSQGSAPARGSYSVSPSSGSSAASVGSGAYSGARPASSVFSGGSAAASRRDYSSSVESQKSTAASRPESLEELLPSRNIDRGEQLRLEPERVTEAKAERRPAQDIVPDTKIVEKSVQNVESSFVEDYLLVGELMKTYIVIEKNGEAILIDKHAAHERMIFDRLCAKDSEIESQLLLVPVTIRPQAADMPVFESNTALLQKLGFEIEEFGAADYIVRAVPADMNPEDVAPAIEEICRKLREGKHLEPKQVREEILHTVACKAAIKAGWNTHPDELRRIADAVVSGKVKYCPHGRPVAVTLTRNELDKLFKRIV